MTTTTRTTATTTTTRGAGPVRRELTSHCLYCNSMVGLSAGHAMFPRTLVDKKFFVQNSKEHLRRVIATIIVTAAA